MASPYHQGGGGLGPSGMIGGNQMNVPANQMPGMEVMSGYPPPNMGGISLEGHMAVNDQQDQDPSLQPTSFQEGGQALSQSQSEFNLPVLCRIGLETVHEIVSKATELFQFLRTLQPPTAVINPQSQQIQEERKNKIAETLKNMHSLFRRLRRVSEICNTYCSESGQTDFSSLEPDMAIIQLMPLEQERRREDSDKRQSETIRALLEEKFNLQEQVYMKNKQMKEIIDMLRSIVCEINTMLAMRKKHLSFTNRITSIKNKPSVFQ